jgi:hypothetical protein
VSGTNIKIDENLAKTFLVRWYSPQHAKQWIENFLGLDFPNSWVDPDSNSSPIHWMYETYKMYEANTANKSPDTIVISSRESYKTLSEAVFAIVMMSHFGATIAHMAAIVPQASAAQKYIDMFITKVKPYLEHHGIALDSNNSKEISMKLDPGTIKERTAYMKIIVCTVTGANSSHTNIFTIDEIDTIRSKEQIRAYNEAQFIPGLFNGQHPVTIKTSTLKFPGGLFSKEMEKALKKNYRVFRWNIIDITEKCDPERHRPDLPMETVYVGKSLPLKTITPIDFEQLNVKEHDQYDKLEAMGGCAKCPLFPVCRGRLAGRSEKDKGGLWKNIDFTMAQFDKTDPDLAEAQLMCWKPSSAGMVYPRFLDKADGTGNTYTLAQAYTQFTGEECPKDLRLEDFIIILQKRGIKFYGGVDWGFRHAFAITVSCLLPNGEWWLVDAYSIPGLEFEQMIDLAMSVRDTYKPVKWYADTSQPMFIKAFKKRKMPCAEFKKDVLGGIEAVRGQIINARSLRRLKVIKHDRTEVIIKMFAEHCFLLDTLGNLTKEPDDGEFADIADTIRYQAQNLFKAKTQIQTPNAPIPSRFKGPAPERTYEDWMTQKIRSIQQDSGTESKGKTADGNIVWDFGSDDGEA